MHVVDPPEMDAQGHDDEPSFAQDQPAVDQLGTGGLAPAPGQSGRRSTGTTKSPSIMSQPDRGSGAATSSMGIPCVLGLDDGKRCKRPEVLEARAPA